MLLDWKLVVIWECQTYSLKKLEERLREAMPSVEEKVTHEDMGENSFLRSFAQAHNAT
jgi:G:T-mismatch repair DNA endonuclease (very short patch repair protein)